MLVNKLYCPIKFELQRDSTAQYTGLIYSSISFENSVDILENREKYHSYNQVTEDADTTHLPTEFLDSIEMSRLLFYNL